MDAIAGYHRARDAARNPAASMDDRTWNDLLFDDVFAVLDHTESTLGQQLLYRRLRITPTDADLRAFEALSARMSANVAERERAQMALAQLQNPAGYDLWWLAQPGAIETRPWHVLFPVSAAGMFAALALMTVWGGAVLVVAMWIAMHLVVRFATASLVYGVIGPFRQVGPLLGAAGALAFLRGPDIETLTGSFDADLPQLLRLRRIARWVSRDPLRMDTLTAFVLELLNLLFLIDANALLVASRELRVHGPALLRVIAATGETDAAIAVASFRAGANCWTTPRFVAPEAAATLDDLCHPLLASPVPNSIALGPPHGVLVTGSNMSGKSTFIRTLGVNVIMAQTINTCLASSYAAPRFTVKSCIGRADDLIAGKSYYLVEVEAVLSMVRAAAAPDPHLFLFDELFRGTNAVERVAASEAVLRELIASDEGSRPHVRRTRSRSRGFPAC